MAALHVGIWHDDTFARINNNDCICIL